VIIGRDFFIVISLIAYALAAPGLRAEPSADDPLRSFMWGEMHQRLLGGEPFEFDDRVKVLAPGDAEDSMNVPVLVDASALPDVERIVRAHGRNAPASRKAAWPDVERIVATHGA